jgi:7-cyano-7-deazaguanine synthase
MLAIALGYAEVVEADAIYVGVNAVDYSGYPDCRPEFVAAFANLASLATKGGVEGHPVRIEAPLIHMPKEQIIETGLRLGVDYGLTTSCYDPSISGRPCGHCDSCLIRNAAFAKLGMTDTALA